MLVVYICATQKVELLCKKPKKCPNKNVKCLGDSFEAVVADNNCGHDIYSKATPRVLNMCVTSCDDG